MKNCWALVERAAAENASKHLEEGCFVVSGHRRKPQNQQLISQLGGHARWGACEDRTEGTAKPRAEFEKTFIVQAGGDPAVRFDHQPRQIQQRAQSLRKAYFTRLALKSAQARARRKGSRGDGATFQRTF